MRSHPSFFQPFPSKSSQFSQNIYFCTYFYFCSNGTFFSHFLMPTFAPLLSTMSIIIHSFVHSDSFSLSKWRRRRRPSTFIHLLLPLIPFTYVFSALYCILGASLILFKFVFGQFWLFTFWAELVNWQTQLYQSFWQQVLMVRDK